MKDAPDPKPATPMIAQYLAIKREAGEDALLFYRMGDFYELFFRDAARAAAALDIALTTRGEHDGAPIPMCGVPVHAAESYLQTLIRRGFRVAVCEQLETPEEARARAGSKAVVRRGITRLVTPGTLTEDALLDARAANHLAAFARVRDDAALAWADISTGALHVAPCPGPRLAAALARHGARELLVADDADPAVAATAEEAGIAVTALPPPLFDSAAADRRLRALFAVATLDAFGPLGRAEVAALGALVGYVEDTQRGRLPLLRPPRRERAGERMEIDAATRRGLELTERQGGGRDGSLLHAVDRTVTAAGARLLERRLAAPLRDLARIRRRHDAVAWAVAAPREADALRAALRGTADLARALGRLSLGRGGPRDLAAIRSNLDAAARLHPALDETPLATDALGGHDALRARLRDALAAEPPPRLGDGPTIAPGFDPELDEARTLRDEGRGVVARLQGRYAEATGIASLKVRHNNVLGYFVETTAAHEATMRGHPDLFRHRQTTASQLRWTTAELADLESRILHAAARAAEREAALFAALRDEVLARAEPLHALAEALAALDVAAAWADLARDRDWCRPTVDEGRALRLRAARHPVVERALARTGQPFVANDVDLAPDGDGAAVALLTGPNMAGKSTWLRGAALAAILAQAGAFVPAAEAHLGLVSQVFSRVGAADDLARGRSTFMVEMVETAAILHGADDRALVILDEIGRGTATFDGLSIAWAVLEHLHDRNRCRALFATHYHELAALADRLPGVRAHTMAVREWEGEVVFLHEVRPGAADRSYGVQVARLAGLPEPAVARAREVLAALERGDRESGPRAVLDDLPLFRAAPPPPPARPSAVEARLRAAQPDALTPRAALDLLYELRAALGDEDGA